MMIMEVAIMVLPVMIIVAMIIMMGIMIKSENLHLSPKYCHDTHQNRDALKPSYLLPKCALYCHCLCIRLCICSNSSKWSIETVMCLSSLVAKTYLVLAPTVNLGWRTRRRRKTKTRRWNFKSGSINPTFEWGGEHGWGQEGGYMDEEKDDFSSVCQDIPTVFFDGLQLSLFSAPPQPPVWTLAPPRIHCSVVAHSVCAQSTSSRISRVS